MGVGAGNAPVYLHASADVRMAVVDILISKTFDASVICPAEQTLVIDDAIHDDVVAELERMGARVLDPAEVDAIARLAFEPDGRVQVGAMGQSCANLAAMGGFAADEDTKVLLAPLPTDLAELAVHPLVQEKLMPVLGIVRSPSVEHGIAACEVVTEHGGLGHTSAVYAQDESVIARFAEAIRTGRILVNAPTAVGALGGVYNALTPTFSLGCGTWGGSTTTDNVNYRNLLNVKVVSRRQAPPQWFRVPSDTYFNTGAIESLRQVPAAQVLVVTDADTEARGAVDEVRRHLGTAAVRVFSDLHPEPSEDEIRAGVQVLDQSRADLIVAVGGGSVIDAAKAIRLFHEHPHLSLRELALPFLDARKRVSQYPQIAHKVRLVAVPTTAGTGSEVSPAAVLTVAGRKVTLVDYSLVPDMAVVEPRLTLSMPPGADGRHRRRRAHARARGLRVDLRLALHRRVLPAGHPPHPRGAAARLRGRRRPPGADRHGQRGDHRRAGLLQRVRRASTTRSRTRSARASGSRTAAPTRSSSPTCCATTPPSPRSSCRRPATPPTSRRRSTPRSAGSSASAATPRRSRASGCSAASTTCSMPSACRAPSPTLGIDPETFRAAIDELAMAAFRDPSLRTNPRMPLVVELRQLLAAVAGPV